MTWPVQASSEAVVVDRMTLVLLATSAAVTLLVFLLIAVFVIRYRRGSRVPRGPVPISEGKVEAAWISATTLGFLVFFFWGAHVYLNLESAAPADEEIHVIGRQWMWDVRQPNGRREFDSIHLPAGRRVRLRMTSEDVIHSFFVPAFRMKQDVVPGKEVLLSFTPTRPGEYQLLCTQYCGSKHAEMAGVVVVQRPEDYAAWLASAPAPGQAGRAAFVRYGCGGCHEGGSIVHAPELRGLYGARVPMADGSFRKVDEVYLRDCILQPETIAPAGFPHVMPSFKGVISEADLTEIIAYLKEAPAP